MPSERASKFTARRPYTCHLPEIEMAARAPDGSNCSYEVMKARHKEAYGYLTRALQIDEAGEGTWVQIVYTNAAKTVSSLVGL